LMMMGSTIENHCSTLMRLYLVSRPATVRVVVRVARDGLRRKKPLRHFCPPFQPLSSTPNS